MTEIRQLHDQDFSEGFLKSINRMAVLFRSPWCHGCDAVEKIIEGLSDEEANGCIWGMVDVSIHQDIAKRFGVLNLPTVIIFHNDKEANRLVGRISKEKLLAGIR
ncbi:thioredoxin family protein [bacterium]|nr:thioredoxin family protein [bacterium]